jgi:hypothetical protein
MTKVLLLAAALGLTASAAGACEFMRSADAKVDSMTVASTAAQQPMSQPVAPARQPADRATSDDQG